VDTAESLFLALALAGAAGVVIEILVKERGLLRSLLRDTRSFALEPAPATPPSAPQLRFELVGAGTVLLAAMLGSAAAESAPGGDAVSSAREWNSRMLAGTSLGIR
jgi:hypothetical protein